MTSWGGLAVGFFGAIFGLFSLVLAVMSRRDAERERRRNERLTQTLSRAYRPTALGQVVTAEDRDIRSVLIVVASHEQTFKEAVTQARRLGASVVEVERLASQLRDSGLLQFAPPLKPDTRLSLSR